MKLVWGGRSSKKAKAFEESKIEDSTRAQRSTGRSNRAGPISFISVDYSSRKKGVKRKIDFSEEKGNFSSSTVSNSGTYSSPSSDMLAPQPTTDDHLLTSALPSSGFGGPCDESNPLNSDVIPSLKLLSSLEGALKDENDPLGFDSEVTNFDLLEGGPFTDYSDDIDISLKYEDAPNKNLLDLTPLRNQYYSQGDFETGLDLINEFQGHSEMAIPVSLPFLPEILHQVPKYRELFHFFINKTADCLVPLPAAYQHNPFKHILPRMAMSTPHLLTLILAYAASHQSNYLHQKRPKELIERLMTRTFDGLARSLEDGNEAHSDATLATATMLCSYEVTNGGRNDSWRNHLRGARNIIVARGLADTNQGGILQLLDSRSTPGSTPGASTVTGSPIVQGPQPLRVLSGNLDPGKVSYFLLRVLAYLDILGSLSSPTGSSLLTTKEDISGLWSVPLSAKIDSISNEELGNIDFLLGMELDLIPIYSKVASLVRRQNSLQALKAAQEASGSIPDAEYELENESVISDALMLSQVLLSCANNTELRRKDLLRRGADATHVGLASMSLLFTYAVLLHLYRRVLLLSSDSSSVKEIIGFITSHLESDIEPGSPIEACLAFPIVTTACETKDPEVRKILWARLRSMTRFGIGHIAQATELVKRAWAEDKTWSEILEETGFNLVLA